MINFEFNQNCYGCRNCENVCPTNAIEIIENQEGFFVPRIDRDKCIECGACEKKCPQIYFKSSIDLEKSKWFSCYSKNLKERRKSTSGGVFPVLAKHFLENDGLVCGCIWDDDMRPIHILTDNIIDMEKMRGSKYVQSDLKQIAIEIKKYIVGKKILFTGTPCQIAAIKLYVGEHPNLYTCGVFCEGVPSYKVWKKYVEHLEKKYNSKLINVCFRDKEIGWNTPIAKYEFENGKVRKTLSYSYDKFVYGFLQGLYLRNSCNECKYKANGHNSDILIGDLWGADKELLRKTEYQGVSAVIINTDKGDELFNKVKEEFELNKIEKSKVIEYNLQLVKSIVKNKNREKFFYDLDKQEIIKNIEKNIDKRKYINNLKEFLYKTKIFKFLKSIKGE